MMSFIFRILVVSPFLFAVCTAASTTTVKRPQGKTEDPGKVISIRHAPDHWIAISKPSPSFPVTLSQTTTVSGASSTSPPVRYITKRKNKKKEKYKEKADFSERRHSNGYTRYRQRYKYHDLVPEPDDYEKYYYKTGKNPAQRNSQIGKSASFLSPSYHPSASSASTTKSTVGTIYADSPSVSRYVIEDPSTYFVHRIPPGSYYVKPNRRKDILYSSESQSIRRLDSLDYDDFSPADVGLPPSRSVTGFGPQSSFPPRQIMNKITQPGQRQPCHGPECHQHHKGLVRFYWRRVVYPNDGRRRPRNRFRGLRSRTTTGRRRLRDRVISPSDQRDTYHQENDEENSEDNQEENDGEENNDDDEEEEEGTHHYPSWRPGRGYGLDLDEGYNYQDSEKRLYRDKRRTINKMKKLNNINYDH